MLRIQKNERVSQEERKKRGQGNRKSKQKRKKEILSLRMVTASHRVTAVQQIQMATRPTDDRRHQGKRKEPTDSKVY